MLVGDPCQLPPTVLSKAAEASLLAQSLFERLAKAGWPVQLLQEQYRSHPAISAFPSKWVPGLVDTCSCSVCCAVWADLRPPLWCNLSNLGCVPQVPFWHEPMCG